MHLLAMGMNYRPERIGIGPLTGEMCEYLVSQGHRVSVATAFPHYPAWKIQEGYRGRLFMRENINGVEVHRSFVHVPGKPNAFQRVLYDSSLSLSAFLSGLSVGQVDLILGILPPIQLGVMAGLLSMLKRASLVLLVQDLALETALAVGMLKNPLALKLGRAMEKMAYRRAEKIIVICRGFADNLRAKGVPGSKIVILHDWVDVNFIRPLERNNAFRQEHQIGEEQFLVLHAGNMGAKQGLMNVVEAAGQVRDGNIQFILVGDGSQKSSLMAEAERRKLDNIKFLPLQPHPMLPHMLSAADVLLLNQGQEIVEAVIPSKLLTYMAAGRPIIAAVHPDSEAARLVREADCGLVVSPARAEELVRAVNHIKGNPHLQERFGRKARAFAEQNFARHLLLERYEKLLVELASRKDR